MIIKIEIIHEDEQGGEWGNNFIFASDELTSATSKVIIFLQEQQQKEMVV